MKNNVFKYLLNFCYSNIIKRNYKIIKRLEFKMNRYLKEMLYLKEMILNNYLLNFQIE